MFIERVGERDEQLKNIQNFKKCVNSGTRKNKSVLRNALSPPLTFLKFWGFFWFGFFFWFLL